ncbi:hypothetical protein SUGI_1035010 [Cryptomeria japonica]|nr:hypothetical protein SUGI_1035010 [Cryptomeria japonica]
MTSSEKEPDNSRFIHDTTSEENEGDTSQTKSSTSELPCTNWTTLGIGPWREDGLGSSKGKAMATEKKSYSGSGGLCTNWLTLKIGSCIEDGSNKCIYAMEKGESSSSWSCREDGSNTEVKVREESFFVGDILEDILNIIFCKLPLHTLFQVQIVCTSWKTIISSSVHFHNLWEQSNMQIWLVMDLYDKTSDSSNGLAIFDASRRLMYKKMFNDELRCSNSQWFLRAGDGGLLVYTCRRSGSLRVINPLTMQSHCVEDTRQTTNSTISFYMKRYHDDADVHIKVNPEEKTYQVIVIIANRYLVERNKKLLVLIYKSGEQIWEIRDALIEQKVNGHRTICFFTTILTQNEKVYWFSEDGFDVGTYDLNGDGHMRFLRISGMQGVTHKTLGIVMHKGRIIMVCRMTVVCRGKPMELPRYTHTLNFHEFDELGLQWRSKYEAIVSPKNLPTDVICVGGDYIWVLEEIEGYVNHVICVDIDTGELNIWPELCELKGRDCLSMRLSFRPCS